MKYSNARIERILFAMKYLHLAINAYVLLLTGLNVKKVKQLQSILTHLQHVGVTKMSNQIKERADKIRNVLCKCSDDDLVYFAYAIHSGEIKPEPLESVVEFIKRTGREYKSGLPF